MSQKSPLSKSFVGPTLIAAVASFLPRLSDDDATCYYYQKTEYTFSLVHPSFRKAIMTQPQGLPIGSVTLEMDSNEICAVVVTPFTGVQPKFVLTDCFHIGIEGRNATYHELLNIVLLLKQNSRSSSSSHPPLITELKVMYEDDVNHDDDLLQDLLEEISDHLESLDAMYVHMGVFEAVRLPKLRFLTLSEPKGLALSLSAIIPHLLTCDLFTSHTRRRQPVDFLELFVGEKLYLDGLQINFTGREIKDPSGIGKLSVIDCKEIDSIELENYSSLQTLLLSRTAVDNLDGIWNCTSLQLLNASGCQSLKDVNSLHRLKCLKELFLHQTSVTNAGILGLAACINLEKLNLGGCTNVSNVNCLGALVFLRELHLWSTKITDEGIVELQGCHSLVELVLDDCPKITDVSCLKDLSFLRFLSLIQTSVDENGIKNLQYCPLLECLGISGTQIEDPPKLWNHDSVLKYLSLL